MTVPLPRPFDREYMQLALVVAVLVGATAPLIGTFLVQKRLSLIGDGIGHVAFAGVAAGLLTGIAPLWTAFVVSVAAALAIEWLRLRGRASGDLVLAVFFYAGIAGGVVLVGLAGSLDGSILAYLFGSLLTITPADALTTAALGLVIVAVVATTWRALFAVAVDEEAARVAGLPVEGLSLGLAALTATTVVAAMRVVGVLLVAALMVLPVGAAQRVCRSFRATLLASAAFGAGSATGGLSLAGWLDLAPGATIVLVAAGAFLAAVALATFRARQR